ncbi:spore germination protein GerPB [Bacillus mesophilum]|uniref:Spore gernimation protein n=1 Tax=Bacillus mesophilum TaxID=1071718 RepID=A0A7V7RJG3_9BACI|nr:spore germination protein GerPB [Bacillus mesophilum]KAB2330921.1 spore gernimation protein [Bacillus mesophilum]
MNFYIQQSIHINMIKIGGVSNSSVLQIGSAGIIKPASYLYNTGGFTEPAPEVIDEDENMPVTDPLINSPAVPLVAPSNA